jgi:hypothetical protein
MVQVDYIKETDELKVIFAEEVDIPEVVKLNNGVIFEFAPDYLSTIILPNFGQMMHFQGLENAFIEFESFTSEVLKIKIDEQIINIKIDLSELEN